MNRPRTGPAVLARFPDVSDLPQSPSQAEEGPGRSLWGSNGRWIDQAMSIKLLACVTVLLLVGAVLPFCLGPKSPTGDPTTAADALSSWQPKPGQSATTNASVQTGAVAESGGSYSVAQVSATSDQPPPLAAPPLAVAAQREPPPPPTVAGSLMPPQVPREARPAIPPQTVATTSSSLWAPPADAGQPPQRPGESPTANANQAAAARSPEYEANARGHRPGEPPAAQFDGTIEGPKR